MDFDFGEVKGEVDRLRVEVADLKQDVEQVYGELEAVSVFVAHILASGSGREGARSLVGRTSVRDARSDYQVGIERFKVRLAANLEDNRS